jgi:hypothetical protein
MIHNFGKSESKISHMGMMKVKIGLSLFLTAIQGSSPFSDLGLPARSNSHSVVARGDSTRIPLATGKGPRGQDHSSLRHLKPSNPSVRPLPDRPRLIGPRQIG